MVPIWLNICFAKKENSSANTLVLYYIFNNCTGIERIQIAYKELKTTKRSVDLCIVRHSTFFFEIYWIKDKSNTGVGWSMSYWIESQFAHMIQIFIKWNVLHITYLHNTYLHTLWVVCKALEYTFNPITLKFKCYLNGYMHIHVQIKRNKSSYTIFL